MSIVHWVVFASVMLSSVRGAYADPLAKPTNIEARAHLQKGNTNYNIHQFEKAIDEYKAGALSEDAPVFLFNLGQCYRMLGKHQDALWHYERFLAKGKPEGELKEQVDGFIREMKDNLEKQSHPSRPVDVMPLPTTAATAAQPTPQQVVEPWYADKVGWILAGSGTVATLVGGYLLLDAGSLDDQANNEDRQDVRDQLHDKASGRRVAGAISGIAGLGLVTVGIVKLVIHDDPANGPVSVGFTGHGLFVAGSF